MNRYESGPPQARGHSTARATPDAREIMLGLMPLTAAVVFVLSLLASSAQAAEPTAQAAAKAMSGQKLDSGLGELPPYSQWADKTGKSPMLQAAIAGEKLDSGLGELPHYSLWADPSGKSPMPAKTATPLQVSSLR